MKSFLSHSKKETLHLGKLIGSNCTGGEILGLNGELGSGKTVVTQGLADGLRVNDSIHSPTFTLLNEYHGRLWLYHSDFYRLERKEEVFNLGLDDYIHQKGVLVIEWADKFKSLLPSPRLDIFIQTISEAEREISFEFVGDFNPLLKSQIESIE